MSDGNPHAADPVDWRGWLRRWEAQQSGYVSEREERFRIMHDARDRVWSDESFAELGIETAEQWWDALGHEPSMPPLIAERTRRLASKERPPSTTFDQHVEALRNAGFREVATVWQSGTDRVLLAVR